MLRLALLVVALAAPAGKGWREVTLAELKGTPDYSLRLHSPTGDLRASGDFDGDRKRDQAVLVGDDARRRYAVEIRLANGKRFWVAEGPLANVGNVSVSAVLRGRYQTVCGKGYGEACKGQAAFVTLRHSGVEVGYYEKASALYYWTGSGFAEAWTSD